MFGHPGILLSVAPFQRNVSVAGIASIQRQEFGRKNWQRQEVIAMNYTSPEITKLAEATVAICSEDQTIKHTVGADIGSPHRMTSGAYVAED